MNFYEHQDRAERRTKLIVFLFVLAVLCIVSIVAVPVGFATEWKPEPIIVTRRCVFAYRWYCNNCKT